MAHDRHEPHAYTPAQRGSGVARRATPASPRRPAHARSGATGENAAASTLALRCYPAIIEMCPHAIRVWWLLCPASRLSNFISHHNARWKALRGDGGGGGGFRI